MRRLWVLRPGDWLDVGSAAVVEVTSEDGAHPSNPHCSKARNVAGARLARDLRPFGWCSTNRKSCDGSG